MESAVPHWPAPVSVVRPFIPCFLGVIRLGDGGIQLVAAGGVVALEFVINFCGVSAIFFQTICMNKGDGLYIL